MTVRSCTAFSGQTRIASGNLPEIAGKARDLMQRDRWAQVLVFDDASGELIDFELKAEDAPGARRPGRPKLGVIAREVTLLPEHWDWLASQPGGASVALRKLVHHARSAKAGADRQRAAQEATYRFISAAAGNEPEFEEATRALFAGMRDEFERKMEGWPADLRDYAMKLADGIGE